MISLLWFLMAWFAVVGIGVLVSLLTTSLALRFSFHGTSAILLCAFFLGGSAVILLSAGGYLLGVDWSQSLTLTIGSYNDTLLLP